MKGAYEDTARHECVTLLCHVHDLGVSVERSVSKQVGARADNAVLQVAVLREWGAERRTPPLSACELARLISFAGAGRNTGMDSGMENREAARRVVPAALTLIMAYLDE